MLSIKAIIQLFDDYAQTINVINTRFFCSKSTLFVPQPIVEENLNSLKIDQLFDE